MGAALGLLVAGLVALLSAAVAARAERRADRATRAAIVADARRGEAEAVARRWEDCWRAQSRLSDLAIAELQRHVDGAAAVRARLEALAVQAADARRVH